MADYPIQCIIAGDATDVPDTGVVAFQASDLGGDAVALMCGLDLDQYLEPDGDLGIQCVIAGDTTDVPDTGVVAFQACAALESSFESRMYNQANYWESEISNQKMQGGAG